MSQSIPLTRGYSALIDDSDYALVSPVKGLYVGSGYAGRFITRDRQKKLLYLHRFLLNALPDERVDHINGDRLDCRRDNLRLVTSAQNQQNKRPPPRSTSGFKGVCWHKGTSKWHVRITVNSQRLHLGYYDDVETAARLYDAAARHFFREYARPNFPDQRTPPEISILLAQILWKRAGRPSSKPGCGGDCVVCPHCQQVDKSNRPGVGDVLVRQAFNDAYLRKNKLPPGSETPYLLMAGEDEEGEAAMQFVPLQHSSKESPSDLLLVSTSGNGNESPSTDSARRSKPT